MDIGVHHIGIVTRDLPRSLAFYAQLLGARSEPLAGHTLLVVGSVRLALTEARPTDPPGYAWGHHVAFALPAAERPALIERLSALRAPHEDVRGRLYARDPDGFTLEFLFTEP